MSQFNKWTTEFGLIREDGDIKIYGAGLISSIKEADYVYSGTPTLINANVDEMLATSHKYGQLQNQYFVIDSFDWLIKSLPQIELCLDKLDSKS